MTTYALFKKAHKAMRVSELDQFDAVPPAAHTAMQNLVAARSATPSAMAFADDLVAQRESANTTLPWDVFKQKALPEDDDIGRAIVGLFTDHANRKLGQCLTDAAMNRPLLAARLRRFHATYVGRGGTVENAVLGTWAPHHIWCLIQAVYGPENVRDLVDQYKLPARFVTKVWPSVRKQDPVLADYALFFLVATESITRAELIHCTAFYLNVMLKGKLEDDFIELTRFNTPLAELYLLRPLQRALSFTLQAYWQTLTADAGAGAGRDPVESIADLAARLKRLPPLQASEQFEPEQPRHISTLRQVLTWLVDRSRTRLARRSYGDGDDDDDDDGTPVTAKSTVLAWDVSDESSDFIELGYDIRPRGRPLSPRSRASDEEKSNGGDASSAPQSQEAQAPYTLGFDY